MQKNHMNLNRDKLQDVVVIRSFAIIIVVAFHAYGMMYANHLPESKETYNAMYYTVNQCGLINIAMPLFVFISGYLFSYLIGLGKYPHFWTFVGNKFKRLIVPYWIFCCLIMLTNNFFDYTSLISGSFSHLWFITMLFWCFIVKYSTKYLAIDKSWTWKLGWLIISFILLPIDPFLPPIMGVHYLSRWYFWFYAGYVIYPYKKEIIAFITKYKLYIPLVGIYIAISATSTIVYDTRTIYSECAKLAMVVFVWYIVNKLILLRNGEWANSSFFIQMSKYSYGIYIFHNWVQPYLISRTMKRLFPVEQLAQQHTILFPLCFFLLSLMISYYLAKFSLKTRVGRFLIG